MKKIKETVLNALRSIGMLIVATIISILILIMIAFTIPIALSGSLLACAIFVAVMLMGKDDDDNQPPLVLNEEFMFQ